MTSILFIVPAGLILYVLWKAIRQPIFLASIPFFHVMGTSIFFDKMSIFWMPGRLARPIIIILRLFLITITKVSKVTISGMRKVNQVPPLSEEQNAALGQLFRKTDLLRVRTRAQMVLLSAETKLKAEEIVEILRKSPIPVFN